MQKMVGTWEEPGAHPNKTTFFYFISWFAKNKIMAVNTIPIYSLTNNGAEFELPPVIIIPRWL